MRLHIKEVKMATIIQWPGIMPMMEAGLFTPSWGIQMNHSVSRLSYNIYWAELNMPSKNKYSRSYNKPPMIIQLHWGFIFIYNSLIHIFRKLIGSLLSP